MKEKKLLIVENCGSSLKFEQDSDSIILTGLFTTFCQKNRNGRIYESADFLPHVEALKEQMEAGALLGELDHPHSFETTLSNVSHVIENLEYDAKQNAIVGRVRLLNTSKGKEAQALIKDGIPLHISSRAAGTVDESGKVRLQQLFTYDLVAEPGFANARLKRVNESYGFSDDGDVAIFDLTEGMNTELTPEIGKEGGKLTANDGVEQIEKNKIENTNNSTNNMDNGQYISYSDFQRYSEHLSDIITDLQSAIANYKTELTSIKGRPTMEFDPENVDNSMIANLIAKEVETQVKKVSRVPQNSGAVCVKCGDENCDGSCDGKVSDLERKAQAMEEKYSNLVKYVSYIAENLDKSITHQDYIVEETNNIIKHNNYLAEHMNNVIKHNDYLAENMNNVIKHNNYIVENLNDTIG
ncbi:MAG: hypothetical protein J1E95_10920, partial [Muribaculaceae bacterium]|nr:hypothetical protein [Muribaculaceae bacterium]